MSAFNPVMPQPELRQGLPQTRKFIFEKNQFFFKKDFTFRRPHRITLGWNFCPVRDFLLQKWVCIKL